MRKAFIWITLWLCFGGVSAAAEPFSMSEKQEDYLNALQKKAAEKQLSQTGKWRALMHFHRRLMSDESTIDTPSFFFAPNGKYDPKAELNATLRAFFTPISAVEKTEGKADDYRHPRCLFPGRYEWLDKQLGFDKSLMPAVKCTDYREFKATIAPERTALIFTSAYMGNPASFFGHTLLRLDSAGETPLLSHAVNYGAVTGTDGGLAFIVKGVFGGYGGVFSVYPYYDTVNLYNNMENRDIWEYRLNLTPEQTNELIAHIWELGHNSADYYFFSENCSYMMLETLNIVFPDKDLTDDFYHPFFSNYTIPIDTVRTVLAQKGALKKAVYRPSRQSKIRHAYARLSDAEKKELRRLLKAPRQIDAVAASSSLTPVQKANVMETAYEYIQYQFIAKKIPLDEMRRDSVKLLTALSAIDEKSDIPPVPTPDVRPDQGHLSGAAGIYGGRRDGRNFIEFNIRPAYHTLLDETGGYLPFGAITYLDTTLRWYDGDNDLRLQRLALVDITSYAPVNELFKPFSFRMNLGFESYAYPPEKKEGYVFYGSFGGGVTTEITDGWIVFLFSNLYGKAGGYLPHNGMAGISGQAGFAADLGRVRLTGDAERIFYTDNDADIWRYQAQASVSLTKDLTLNSGYVFEDSRFHDIHEFKVGIQVHF